MIASYIDRLRYEARRLVGRILASGRLHRIRHERVEGVEIVLKSRRLASRLAIAVGNLYLRWQRSDVVVLSDHAWLQWEFAVEAATRHGVVLQTPPSPHENFRGLISRVCPGRSLRSILTDPARSRDEQFAAIRSSLVALHQLHRHQADWGHGIQQSISHGDATVNNVIVNKQPQSATWIDFDTRHHPQLSVIDRHADDLRALIFSVASCLPQSCYPRLAAELIVSQPDASILNRFRQRLMTDWSKPNTFQLAQAPLTWARKMALSDAMLQTLSVVGELAPALVRCAAALE